MSISNLLTAVVVAVSAVALTSCLPVCKTGFAIADEPANDRDAKLNTRYLQLLKRNPREGTAFQRVYQFYSDRGQLDSFVDELRQQTKTAPDDGATWMLLGLFSARQNDWSTAATAFSNAVRLRETDPVAFWYLGRALQREKKHTDAVAAYEKALSCRPARIDQQQIFRELARLHEQQRQPDKALEVWQRYESAFPGDESVQEELTAMLLANGQLDAALTRLQKLITLTRDPEKTVRFGIQLAEIQQRKNQPDQACRTLLELQNKVRPESWLHADLRRRFDDIHLRTGNVSTLVEHYRQVVNQHPADVDAMLRLAQFSEASGDLRAAEEWLRKAADAAPRNEDIFRQLVAFLTKHNRAAQAIQLFEKLDAHTQLTADQLEQWGRLYLRRSDLPAQEVQAAAARIWKRIAATASDDPSAAVRTAELLAAVGESKQAEQMYRQAVALAPGNAEYHEYLGEFLYSSGNADSAIRAWEGMAVGENENAENLLQLVSVLEKHQLTDAAARHLERLCELAPSVANLLKLADTLNKAGHFDDAMRRIEQARKIARTESQQEQVEQAHIACLAAAGRLEREAQQLAAQLHTAADADGYLRLARYLESLGRLPEAAHAVQQSAARQPVSVNTLKAAVRIFEKAGLLADAAAACEQLVRADGRHRSVHLQKLASLNAELGATDAALDAARNLIDAAPENPEHYRTLADLCFATGRTEEGLDALREAVRINGNDTATLTILAQTLAENFYTDEAINVYWRLFDSGTTPESRLAATRALAVLYRRHGSMEDLIAELQQRIQRTGNPDLNLCLAVAFEADGRPAEALSTLETLLTAGHVSADLLRELSHYAEQAGDMSRAIRYQARLNELRPTVQGTDRLANLQLSAGRISEADAAVLRYSDPARPQHEVLAAIDRFIELNDLQVAEKLTDELQARADALWEVLLRKSIIAWKTGDHATLRTHCRNLLNLRLSTDQPVLRGTSAGNTAATASESSSVPPPLRRLNRMQQFARKLNLAGVAHGANIAWQPTDFGEARAVAVLLLLRIDGSDRTKQEATIERLLTDARDSSHSEDSPEAWDAWYGVQAYFMLHRQPSKHVAAVIRKMAASETVDGYVAVISAARILHDAGQQSTASSQKVKWSAGDLDCLLGACRAVREQRPDWLKICGASRLLKDVLLENGRSADFAEYQAQLLRPEATAAELADVFELAKADSDLSLMLTATERLCHAAVDANPPVDPRWAHSICLTALTALQQDSPESYKQCVVLLLDTSAAAHLHDAQEATPTDWFQLTTSAHYQIFRNNAEAHPLMFRTLSHSPAFSSVSVEVLLNLREFDRHDRQQRLWDVVQRYRAEAQGKRAAVAELALAQLAFLNEQEERAVVHLIRAAELLPEDAVLRIRLARWFQQHGEFQDSLLLLDTVDSTNQDVRREKELLALELAAETGDASRATRAADALAGLRLSTSQLDTVVDRLLAAGLPQKARMLDARRRSGDSNSLDQLAEQMKLRLSEEKKQTAVEMAFEILRQTDGLQRGHRSGLSIATLRSEAVRVLDACGRLDDLIARTQQAINASPESESLHRQLLEWYEASGQTQRARLVRARLEEIAPATVDDLLQQAGAADRAGQYDVAAEKYLQVLSKDPHRFSQNYYQLLTTFRRAGRLPELADILLNCDLRKLQNNYYVVNETVRTLFAAAFSDRRGDVIRSKALALFEAAWKAFPNNRTFLLSEIQDESLWQLPLMVDYAAEGLIPRTLQQSVISPWKIITGRLVVSRDAAAGQAPVSATLTRLIASLERHNRTDEFVQRLEKATHKFPRWTAGKLVLAVLYEKTGQTQRAGEVLTSVVAESQSNPIPGDAAYVVSLQLENASPSLLPIVLQLTEQSDGRFSNGINADYRRSIGRVQATLLLTLGQAKDAQLRVLQTVEALLQGIPTGTENEETNRARIDVLTDAAQHLASMGFPIAAFRFYTEAAVFAQNNGLSQNRSMLAGRQRSFSAIQLSHIQASFDAELATACDRLLSGTKTTAVLLRPNQMTEAIQSAIVLRCQQLAKQSPQAVAAWADSLLSQPDTPLAALAVLMAVPELATDADRTARMNSQLRKRFPSETPIQKVGLEGLALAHCVVDPPQWLAEDLKDTVLRVSRAAASQLDDAIWLQSLLFCAGEAALLRNRPDVTEQAWAALLEAILSEAEVENRTEASAADGTEISAIRELRGRLLVDSQQ